MKDIDTEENNLEGKFLWELDIENLVGHNIEAKGRDEVNELLTRGWILLHIYTLKYKEDDVWRERPMAILGLPRNARAQKKKTHEQQLGLA
ncbi:MAG: hypothetical protein HYT10_00080 [Candidatus Levybacteria bacterium]|nr:hypothetical protein [Candidatus Levybacteria bacterium]